MGKYKVIPEQKDEYLGNMWGWKISLIGLALIIIMLGLMLFRSCQIANVSEVEPTEQLSK